MISPEKKKKIIHSTNASIMQLSERAHYLPDIILSPGDTKPSKICGLCLQEA